jgi:hypothetical protein
MMTKETEKQVLDLNDPKVRKQFLLEVALMVENREPTLEEMADWIGDRDAIKVYQLL